MIKGLMGSTGVVVDAGNTALPYVSQNDSNSFQGLMRIRGSDIQYYDNGMWNTLPSSYATVRLDPNTESLLQWCDAQRKIAIHRTEMAMKHPALENALAAIKRAEDNYDLLAKFVEHDNDDSVQQSP